VKIWIDAQLSPAIAQWLTATQAVEASALRELGLRDAEDSRIFFAARHQGAIVMSKDRDFVDLVLKHGPPPQIIWITCGLEREASGDPRGSVAGGGSTPDRRREAGRGRWTEPGGCGIDLTPGTRT
jgi:predicted nuclease of predicted toxin-antitoxin system